MLLAQRRRVKSLPALPNLQEVPTNQQVIFQQQPMQPVEFTNQNYQPYQSVQFSQNTRNFERYFVYVDSDSSQTLRQVQQIERSAYFRQLNGRTVIQSGVFSRRANAEQRLRELASRGVYNAGIGNFSNTQETIYPAATSDNRSDGSVYQTENSNFYYVAIPASSRNLFNIAERIRQNIGTNVGVYPRNQPRGPHVAVGPFPQRTEAEQWNNYLQKAGFGNARVYYGR
ncbi:hypothetical protein NIES4074_07400 [Cylindrospermum sp. NIES-4074]|nr:hypothetical protein NIES4074_07400 [Cylindrospermum sp. NIES-4074]